ncbi:hypothetical protein [Legionella sp. km772]|uniref:hypothetical protein n=1 Tax=Legionella sp. km772 TaxID=2498111 RepID=UPI000F8EB0E4|nr:hypothetical protein [Legionella sp. km772]RUR05885.1 hypothetical protein ELY15_13795 [Legionella sp. km772]
MLIIAIVLFLLAAVFGLALLVAVLQDRPTQKAALFLHGALALAAISCVIVYMFIRGSSPLLLTSLALFILAALGGLTLATLDISHRKIPKLIAVLHPLIALAGLIVLLAYVLP